MNRQGKALYTRNWQSGRDRSGCLVDLVYLICLINWSHSTKQTRKTRQTDQRSSRPADCFSTLLEDRTALGLRCKPFSLQLLNKSRAVHIEELRRLARNPIRLPERTDDETVLQLLELS